MKLINFQVFNPTFFRLFTIALLGLGFSATAQTNAELEKLTREFVTYEAQHQDLVKAKTYFSPSATFQWPNGSGEKLDVEKYIQIRTANAKFAKFDSEIKAVHVVGNESIVFGSWKGTIINSPKKPEQVGKVSTVPFVYRFFWENDKIKRMEMYWDGKKVEQDWGNNQ